MMNNTLLREVLSEIDTNIGQLQAAKGVIESMLVTDGKRPKRTVAPAPKKKRKMSAEARKRIGDATRRRWAERRKAASAKKATAKTPA